MFPDIASIVSSTKDLVATLGSDIYQVIFGVFPTWFIYAVPLAVLALVVTYLLHRRHGRSGR